MKNILACPSAHVQLGRRTFPPGHFLQAPPGISPVGQFPRDTPVDHSNQVLRLLRKIASLT